MRAVVAGGILCLIGFIIFVYGITNINNTTAVSGSYIVVVGIFAGMAGLLMLMINLFHSQSTS